ncbi:MAG: cutinase family protein [Microbacterium sp.]|nr:cutinase family protein [Microbacterium sp.]
MSRMQSLSRESSRQNVSTSKTRRRQHIFGTITALALFGNPIFGGVPAATAAQATNLCDFAIFIGVRGTGAAAGTNLAHNGRVWTTGGHGAQVAPIVTDLINSGDMPFYFESLAYPATSVLGQSIDDGVAKLTAELNYIAQTCPWAPIILAGHSQGASVISRTLAGPNIALLSADAKAAVSSVVLYGDPFYETGRITNYPDRPNNGAFWDPTDIYDKSKLADYRHWGYPAGSSTQTWLYRVREYCNIGDYFCQNNKADSSFVIHNSYIQYATAVTGWITYTLTDFN